MKSCAILSAILSVTLFGCSSFSPARQDKVPGVQIHFEPGVTLTARQVETVLRLVRQCGLNGPSELRTGALLPTRDCAILVRNADRRQDRKISYDEVWVRFGPWSSHGPRDGAIIQKRFWVDAPFLSAHELIELQFRGATCRVRLGRDVSIEAADRIAAALTAGRIQFARPGLKNQMEMHGIESSKPLSIEVGERGYKISFQKREYDFWTLRFELVGDAILVNGIGMISV